MKFDMASATLSTLATDTRTSHHDLGALVTDLVRCVEPLQGSFHGQGRAAFDRFKGRADEVAAELNQALGAILVGQGEMDHAFRAGDLEASDTARQAEASADFAGARFSART